MQEAADQVEQRLVTFGVLVDGRTRTSAAKTALAVYIAGFVAVETIVAKVAVAIAAISDRLATMSQAQALFSSRTHRDGSASRLTAISAKIA